MLVNAGGRFPPPPPPSLLLPPPDLANLVNIGAVKAALDSSPVVSLHHLEFAKDRILMGAERRSMAVSEDCRKVRPRRMMSREVDPRETVCGEGGPEGEVTLPAVWTSSPRLLRCH